MGGSLSTIRWTPSYYSGIDAQQQQRGQPPLRKSKSFPPTEGGGGGSSSPGNSTSNLSYDTYVSEHDYDGYPHNNCNDESSGMDGDHLGTSGILMGVNAPPLYDACLVGRWEDVLKICGEPAGGVEGEGENKEGGGGLGGVAGTGTTGEETDRESHGTNDASHTRTAGTADTEFLSSSSGSDDVEGRGGVGGEIYGNDNADSNVDGGGAGRGERMITPSAAPRSHQANAAPSPHNEDGGGGGDDDDDGIQSEDDRNGPSMQVRYADRRRNTPLHLACRRQPPPRVVRALLNRSPSDAASRRTADGLTPLHFAAYCGAGPEVVGMLVDRMRSDAAVIRATRLGEKAQHQLHQDVADVGGGVRGGLVAPLDVAISEVDQGNRHAHGRLSSSDLESMAFPSSLSASSSSLLPPTRLLDRRRRTPLHCALSGFRTPIRPLVVRKLLVADPASATLGDERGRTPLSLLFDDYAEEVMEALEDDVTPTEARDQCAKVGGELHECWEMLGALLRAAYLGTVSEDDEDGGPHDASSSTPPPQDRAHHATTLQAGTTGEVNVMEIYDRERFSIVHAAAGVWECPAPLARLVLKCMCGGVRDDAFTGGGGGADDNASPSNDDNNASDERRRILTDAVRQPDEETMRLPLHIACVSRPQCRDGYSARLKVWLSSATPDASSWTTVATRSTSANGCLDDARHLSLSGKNNHDGRGRSATTSAHNDDAASTTSSTSTTRKRGGGRVYNPRFGRSLSRDSVVAYSSSLQRRGLGATRGRGGAGSELMIPRSTSNSSISANITREGFLQHTMVKDVLDLYPAAASVVDDRTGKLPIVLAVEHGKSWETAVGPLLEAYSAPFGGGGDGGMALPDDSHEGSMHRAALQGALMSGLTSPEVLVREESIRTAGKLAEWGGVFGMPGSQDGVVSEWLDAMINRGTASSGAGASPKSPEGIIVGPGASAAPSEGDWIQTQSSLLTAVAEVVTHSRPSSISDRVARLCLNTSREYLFSKDGTVREAASHVLGNTLNSLGDADDASNVMREVVLNMISDEGSICSSASTVRGGRAEEDVISKHGRLLACKSILSTQWGSELLATQDICNATIAFIHACVKDKNMLVRSSVYHAIGPILGKSNCDANAAAAAKTVTLKELRSDILKGTRASESVEVQLALARGLTSAARMHPNLFLCKPGMPIMDAALMLAMSSSSSRSPDVQKAFQIFLWVALKIGSHQGNDDVFEQDAERIVRSHVGSFTTSRQDPMSPGLQKYIELAEGENGRIMMKFVTQTLAKIEDLNHDQSVLCRY